MKLIYLYGPSGAGKLTVAEELAKLTGYKVFHNYLTVDLVSSRFKFGSELHTQLKRNLQLDIFRYAAEAGLEGLIFTFVYSHPGRLPFVRDVLKMAEAARIEVLFERLCASAEQLEKRIVGESRGRFGKPRTVESLHSMLSEWDMQQAIPGVESLEIENSHLEPGQVAHKIAAHYGLSR
ncbi:MAG: shikimate kinase [Meiothermus sp.]